MKMILFLTVLLLCTYCRAQTWDEWVHQRKTQIQYLEEQIIALQVYGNDLQDGYHIVQGGLAAVHNIKDGDFNLHKNYFISLSTVSSSVAKDRKIPSIINFQLKILQLNTAINTVINTGTIQNAEGVYAKGVMNNILQQCAGIIADLTSLTTKGQLSLQENERIERISALYGDIKDKYTFVAHFKEQVALLALSRQKEANTIQALQSLYNLK